MKFVIQRVKSASVSIDENIYSSIDKGLLVFFCAEKGDESGLELGGKKLDLSNTLTWFAEKILKLRKMNRSVSDINGEILVVSQFTLAANCKKGTRPSFDSAMEPLSAKKAYEDFVLQLRKAADNGEVKSIQTGVFAADMKISLINDGPVTILL